MSPDVYNPSNFTSQPPSKGAPPRIPGGATVRFRLTLNSCTKYATGDPKEEEQYAVRSWRRGAHASAPLSA